MKEGGSFSVPVPVELSHDITAAEVCSSVREKRMSLHIIIITLSTHPSPATLSPWQCCDRGSETVRSQ